MWKSVGWHRHNVRYCSWEVWADLERERDFSGDLINMRLIITPTSSALGKRFSKIPWIRATILTGSGRGSRGECGRHIIDSTVQSTLHFVMFVSSLALVGRSSEMIYNGAHIILRGQFIEFNMLLTSPNDALNYLWCSSFLRASNSHYTGGDLWHECYINSKL